MEMDDRRDDASPQAAGQLVEGATWGQINHISRAESRRMEAVGLALGSGGSLVTAREIEAYLIGEGPVNCAFCTKPQANKQEYAKHVSDCPARLAEATGVEL